MKIDKLVIDWDVLFFYCRNFRKWNGCDFEENYVEKVGSVYKYFDDVSFDWIGFFFGVGVDSVCYLEVLWWKR